MIKCKRWDRVEVFWQDSHQIHGWIMVSDADIDEESSLGHRSIGYFLGETPGQITMCQSSKTYKDFLESDDTHVNGVFTIPKKAITKIVKI